MKQNFFRAARRGPKRLQEHSAQKGEHRQERRENSEERTYCARLLAGTRTHLKGSMGG
jgi:hypothetical protein